jgi:hypothetical protein
MATVAGRARKAGMMSRSTPGGNVDLWRKELTPIIVAPHNDLPGFAEHDNRDLAVQRLGRRLVALPKTRDRPDAEHATGLPFGHAKIRRIEQH